MEDKETVSRKGGVDLTGALFSALLVPWAFYLIFSLLIGGRDGPWSALIGLLFFQACNAFIYKRSPTCFPLLSLSSLDLFTNTSVSLIHSTIVGLSVSYILMREWYQQGLSSMYNHEELFYAIWPMAKTVLCFSSGYFVYDQVDMIRRHLYNPKAPSLLVHHAVLLVCFTMALYRQVTINYLILTLLCELHSIFLHLRRVLRMACVRKEGSWLVSIEWSFNWITFFTSRMVMHTFIIYKLLIDSSKFPSGIEWPLAISGMTGLHILNVLLGVDLFRAFRKERAVQRSRYKAS